MPENDRVLTTAAARAFYDRFGAKQDKQGWYEDAAIDDLVTHSGVENCHSVFEFGCGTGKLAIRLLKENLCSTAIYLGCDVSPVMAGLARDRLRPYSRRAVAIQSDGAVRFPLADQSVDCVMAVYVLDLLLHRDIEDFFAEARRVLGSHGRLCIASLAPGRKLHSRLVSGAWNTIFRLNPALLGGCRPIHLDPFVDSRHWKTLYRNTVVPRGITSQVCVLQRKRPA